MSFYIIFRGPAGAGKTTIAKELSQIYNAHHICIDTIKHKLGLKHSEEEKIEANKNVIKEAIDYLKKGRIVIIDEVLYYKKQLFQLENLSYPSYLFSLDASMNCCLERNKKRREKNGRTLSDSNVKIVHELVSKLKKGIEINTENKTIKQTVEKIMSYLPKPENQHKS